MVSVIIPAFNAGRHLRRTLQSALAQTWTDLEVIVVDDGSTDDTAAIAREARAQDRRVHLIRKPNAGVGAARNAGIRLARGKYIAPLDADDLWAPQKLERQVRRMEDAGPQAGLVYCWSRHIDQQDHLIRWSYPMQIEGRIGFAMILGNLIGNASVPLLRASALATVGLYLTRARQDGAQGCEDWDLHLRIAEKYRLYCVPEYLVSYRQGGDNMSMNAASMARSYETVMRRARNRNSLPASLESWSNGQFYSYLMYRCYVARNYRGALSCLGRVLRADPAAWLNARVYRIGLLALLNFGTGGRFRRMRPVATTASLADPLFQQPPAQPAPATGLYARLEKKRFAFALNYPSEAVARRHPLTWLGRIASAGLVAPATVSLAPLAPAENQPPRRLARLPGETDRSRR